MGEIQIMKWMKRKLVAFALIVVATGNARASIIVSQFGAGNDYNKASGWTLSNVASIARSDLAQAEAFTPSVTETVDTVSVAINRVTGTNDIRLQLMTDVGGRPGAVL